MFEQPYLIPINEKEYYLAEDFTYEWVFSGKSYKATVYKGFITDGASVPKLFWGIIKPNGLWDAASLLHDFFYCFRGTPPKGCFQKMETSIDKPAQWVNCQDGLIREECDKLFLQVMTEAQVSKGKRETMYKAVRMFGHFAW